MFPPMLAQLLSAATGFAQTPAAASADSGFWARLFQCAERARASQPHWAAPIATSTPRLDEAIRYDLEWTQAAPGAPYAQNFGSCKGVEIIAADNVQITAAIPPYLAHHEPGVNDGFGDAQLQVKYRALSANEQQGNYVVTPSITSTFPTAAKGNGQPSAIVTPMLAAGNGLGTWDITGTVSAGLPTGHRATIGRTYAWNILLQDRIRRVVSPEVEVNTTWLQDGKNDGGTRSSSRPGWWRGVFS